MAAQLKLNVAIYDRNDRTLLVPIVLTESDDVITLRDAFGTRYTEQFGQSPDPWSQFLILRAPQDAPWPIKSDIPALVQNLDPISCTELSPLTEEVGTWFPTSSVDKKCIHVLIIRKGQSSVPPRLSAISQNPWIPSFDTNTPCGTGCW